MEQKDRYLKIHHEILASLSNDDRHIGIFRLSFVYLNGNGKCRNFGDSLYDANEQSGSDYLADLTIRAQYSTTEGYETAYGWDIQYRDSRVDLPLARAMVRTLSKIQRKLDSYEKKWGYCPNFAQFVIRVANALNVKGILVRDIDSGNSWSYDDNDYRSWAPNESDYALAYAVRTQTKMVR